MQIKKKGGIRIMIIDKAAIIRGNEEKAYRVALNEMRDYYSKETAFQFFKTYRSNSLSFIMERLYDITKEAYYGTDFIKNLLNTTMLYPSYYADIVNHTRDIMTTAKENLASKEQISKYEEILKIAKNKLNMIKGTTAVAMCANSYNHIPKLYFDVFYEIEREGDKDEFKDFIEELRYIKDPYLFFTIAPLLLSKYPDYSANVIMEKTKFFYTPYRKDMDSNALKMTLQTVTALNYLSKDEYVIKALDNCDNVNLKFLWKKIMTENIKDYDEMRTNKGNLQENVPIYADGCNNPMAYITQLIEESAEYDINHGRYELEKYINLEHKKVILEHVLECNTLFDDMILSEEAMDHYLDEIAVTDEEMAMLEWEADGEPNEIIKTHIMTKKMLEKENAERSKKDKDNKDTEEPKEDDSVDDIEEKSSEISEDNKKARKEIIEDIDSVLNKIEEKAHYSKKEMNDFLNGKDNSICLGSFNKDTYKETLKTLKEFIKDKKDFDVNEDNYFTIFLGVRKNSEYFIEYGFDFGPIEPSEYSMLYEASDPKDEPEEPEESNDSSDDESVKKPKEDLATKIQNKALDKDAERQKKKAIREEKKTKLRNAGKASTSGIRGEYKSAKSFIEKIDKADENRRKKFMLKPGYRHKIFRNLKHALLYGGVAKVNIFWTPYVAVIRHFSKEKDKRIRNELVRELETEIRICEEKINDANSNGDQQEKYKLMRIKDKLVAEKQRVEINSKYI